MWFIGVDVERETSAPPPKKNPGSAPDLSRFHDTIHFKMRKLSYASLPSLKNVVSHNKQSNVEGKGATIVA